MGTSLRRMSRAEPASWLSARRCRLKDPRWTALRRRVRFTWDCRLILRGDRRGIQTLGRDRGHILVSRDTTAFQRPRRPDQYVRPLWFLRVLFTSAPRRPYKTHIDGSWDRSRGRRADWRGPSTVQEIVGTQRPCVRP